jgi:hypothetical protein
MGVVCQACGAENLGGVSVCRLCAAPLALPATGADGRHKARAGKQSVAGSRWVVVSALAVLVLGALWFAGRSGPEVQTQGQTTASSADGAAAQVPNAPLGQGPLSQADGLAQATAAAEARLQASLERLAREDRERHEAQARERQTQESAAPTAEPVRRPERLATSAGRPRPVANAPAVSEPPAPVAEPEPVRPSVERLPVVAPEPPPVRNVEQRCADSGNFFSRSACQVRLCADPALQRDPVCVRLREIEESRRPAPHLLN